MLVPRFFFARILSTKISDLISFNKSSLSSTKIGILPCDNIPLVSFISFTFIQVIFSTTCLPLYIASLKATVRLIADGCDISVIIILKPALCKTYAMPVAISPPPLNKTNLSSEMTYFL